MFVVGVNKHWYKFDHTIVSDASCTVSTCPTNRLATPVKICISLLLFVFIRIQNSANSLMYFYCFAHILVCQVYTKQDSNCWRFYDYHGLHHRWVPKETVTLKCITLLMASSSRDCSLKVLKAFPMTIGQVLVIKQIGTKTSSRAWLIEEGLFCNNIWDIAKMRWEHRHIYRN